MDIWRESEFMVKFSVIVPIYNVEKYLRQCIESVLKQTYSNLELILVDDGSTDSSPKICDEYAKCDNRVKVIHKLNGGLPAARNSGLRIITGEYFMHLDGDDFWDINYLKNIEPIISKTRKDVYLGNSRYDYYNGKSVKAILYDINLLKEKTWEEIIQYFFYGVNMMPSAACHNVYKTEFCNNNNIYFDETLSWSEDADNFFNVIFHTRDIGFFDYTFYYYRRDNAGAMTKNPSAKHFLSNMKVSNKWFYIVKDSTINNIVKQTVMKRFANGYMYNLKAINCLNNEDYKIVINYIKSNKEMLKYIDGFPCKPLYWLSQVIGFRNVSRILNIGEKK